MRFVTTDCNDDNDEHYDDGDDNDDNEMYVNFLEKKTKPYGHKAKI